MNTLYPDHVAMAAAVVYGNEPASLESLRVAHTMLAQASLAGYLIDRHGQIVSTLPYLYRPIPAFRGQVLKCAGIATDVSRAILAEKALPSPAGGDLTADGYLPGLVELPAYMGDRINAADHSVFA